MPIWQGDKAREEEVAKAKEAEVRAKAELAETKRTAEAEAKEAEERRKMDEQIRADEEARLAQVDKDAVAAQRERAVQMKVDDFAAAKADVKTAKAGDVEKPKARSRRKGEREFQSMLKDGWKALAIKAGNTRSAHDVDYDPATYRLELAEERYAEGGADRDDVDDLPEIRVEEDGDGGWLEIDSALDRDLTVMYRIVPEIRK